ncbi:MAG: hypothetical protein HY865_21720 [Chloroflexi bacterium]|nr:hypothetical protein [Chloroflexota bacterium]
MIKGRTLLKREIYRNLGSDETIGTIAANVEIFATENKYQMLHLVDGGWVNAGAKQQYIKWQVTSDPVPPPPVTPPSTTPTIITGKTLVKRDVYDEPGSEKILGVINANVSITASENRLQWLHLVEGGWVNAGAQQRYIKWQVIANPNVPPPQPAVESVVTEVKRRGRIATLLVDWQNPKWGFAPREVGPLNAYPHTVTFNVVCDHRKGPRVPLTDPILDYLGRLNGEKVKAAILVPNSGWVNNPTIPPTVERLTWAANHIIVKETRMVQEVEYSNVYASSCHAADLTGTFTDKDARLVVHKFNAFTRGSTMIKLGSGADCYTPFITDPNINNGDMWIRSDYLEMWHELPFALSDGTSIVEYELYGHRVFGRRADGSAVLLRDPSGFKTSWRINSPDVPV